MTLRSDAIENRDRIIDAAEELFARNGLDVPMSEIARRAGVGAATLSRRFPSRDSLIDAVFARQLPWWMNAIEATQRTAEPWMALLDVLEDACVRQAHDQVCADIVVRAFLQGETFASERATVQATIERIITAAQREGQAAPDVGWWDIVLLLEANAGAAGLAQRDPESGARRLMTHFRRAFVV